MPPAGYPALQDLQSGRVREVREIASIMSPTRSSWTEREANTLQTENTENFIVLTI